MSPPEHFGYPDEWVNGARSLRKQRQMLLRPGMHAVRLGIGKRHTFKLDDPLIHQELIQIFPQQGEFVRGISPPSDDFRSLQPALSHR